MNNIKQTMNYGYLMVHFMHEGEDYGERVYMDISRGDNPEQWDPLNGGEAVLASNISTTGIRDPFLCYNPQSKTFYIIATDLRAYGGDDLGWSAWQKSYSTKMNVWESKDLISWKDVRQFDVALNRNGDKVAELGMMWAPEATWVKDYYGEGEGAFVVYWSSQLYSDPEHNSETYARIMWGATTDFTQDTFEFGGVLFDPGEARIDTTIFQNGGRTYHVTKKEGRGQLYMEYTDDIEWWLPNTRWILAQDNISDGCFGWLEGPATLKDHRTDGKFYLFVDNYTEYKPMVSTDLSRGWTPLYSPEYYLRPGTKHGGVFSLTKEQYEALRRADAVSLASEKNLGKISVDAGITEDELNAILPKAKVNLAYDRGASQYPVKWDLSSVNTNMPGSYTVTGTVKTLGANNNAWIGEDGTSLYNSPGKKLYSTTALKVMAEVLVREIPSLA